MNKTNLTAEVPVLMGSARSRLPVTRLLMLPLLATVAWAGSYTVTVPAGTGQEIFMAYSFSQSTVSQIFGSQCPEGTDIYIWNNSSRAWVTDSYAFGSWSNPNYALYPGHAIMVRNPGSTSFNIVVSGTLVGSNPLSLTSGASNGYGCVHPDSGSMELICPYQGWELCYQGTDGDEIDTWDVTNQRWVVWTRAFGQWNTVQGPQLGVGEACFIKPYVNKTWDETAGGCYHSCP